MSMPVLTPSPFFFFNDTATTEIYTLSLHDALPISMSCATGTGMPNSRSRLFDRLTDINESSPISLDRKSTRLNSSHDQISYAVFCLKKKNRYQRAEPKPQQAERASPIHAWHTSTRH